MQLDYIIQGAIKIKDGLFIGDEIAASVLNIPFLYILTFYRTKSSFSQIKLHT